ncbi:MAG: conserved repeat domain [Bryobacterales bacterium]|nr:conserved repeat domain [Bryobacterales bacterium]
MSVKALLLSAFSVTSVAQTISFLAPRALGVGGAHFVPECSGCIRVADFNRDGIPDLAVNALTPAPQGGIFLGDGTGAFTRDKYLPWPSYPSGPFRLGDFDADGNPDLFFADYRTVVLRGKGDGTFEPAKEVLGCAGSTRRVDIQVADFNRDGKSDILCTTGLVETSLLVSNGDGTFATAPPIVTTPFSFTSLVADLNADGTPDILLVRQSGQLTVLLGLGNGTFGSEILTGYGFRIQTSAPVLAGDFNGDGKNDLVMISQRGDSIILAPGKGDGNFGPAVVTPISVDVTGGTVTVAADFNKDGKLDFVAGDAVYGGNGDGTFRPPIFFGPTRERCDSLVSPMATACTYSHGSAVVGDFDKNGSPDLAVDLLHYYGSRQIAYSQEVNILLNSGPGNGFMTAGVSAVTGTWPVAPSSIVSAYGVNLAPSTEVAATNPAPTTLGGIRVHVRDRTHAGDRLAPLLYVSPSQVNYVLDSSDPYAWVDIEKVGTPYVPQATAVQIVDLAPAFFAVDYTVTAPGYLSLYGTGFAQAITQGSSCFIGEGDVDLPVSYAGPQRQIAGLDQVNVFLPARYAASGSQAVRCAMQNANGDSRISNDVRVTIR